MLPIPSILLVGMKPQYQLVLRTKSERARIMHNCEGRRETAACDDVFAAVARTIALTRVK